MIMKDYQTPAQRIIWMMENLKDFEKWLYSRPDIQVDEFMSTGGLKQIEEIYFTKNVA